MRCRVRFAGVDLYFDTTVEAITVASADGAFCGINLSIPASAAPGRRWITGAGERTLSSIGGNPHALAGVFDDG